MAETPTTKPRRTTKIPPKYAGEVAYQVDDLYRRMGQYPYNPDELAVKKGGLGIYKKMKQDDQVKACLILKKSAVIKGGWKIEGDDEVQVEFLETVFEKMDSTMTNFIVSLLSAYEYGFSVHEKVYSYIDYGAFRGNIGIKALRPKSPTRLDFEIDDFGNLKEFGLRQRLDTGKINNLPINKFIIYTHQKEFDNVYGESELKAAYTPWFVKTNIVKYWAIYLERFGVPTVKGRTSTGRVTESQKEAFKVLMQKFQSGMSLILPQDLSIDLMESTRTDRGAFSQAKDSMDIAIARAILIPQMIGLVPQAGVGSYGKSTTDLQTFDWIMNPNVREVEDTLNEQLIKQLIDYNYGPQEEYPKFIIKPMKDEDKARMVAAWAEAVVRGAATSTMETQLYVRELLGFPEPEEEEEADIQEALDIEKKAAELAATPKPVSGLDGGNSSGGPSKTGNVPGKANQYSRTFIPKGETRADFGLYDAEWTNLEGSMTSDLSDAFETSIVALIKDAKKKSEILNASSSQKPEA